MRTEAIVKYKTQWPVEIAEMVGTRERVRVDFDKLLSEGATIKDSWRKGGWFVFVLQNKNGLNIPV